MCLLWLRPLPAGPSTAAHASGPASHPAEGELGAGSKGCGAQKAQASGPRPAPRTPRLPGAALRALSGAGPEGTAGGAPGGARARSPGTAGCSTCCFAAGEARPPRQTRPPWTGAGALAGPRGVPEKHSLFGCEKGHEETKDLGFC